MPLLAFESTALHTTMIYEIVKDIKPLAIASLLILLGFMAGFFALLRDSDMKAFSGPVHSFLATFNIAMSFDLLQFIDVPNVSIAWFAMVYSVLFALVIVLVLLNMVIALVSDCLLVAVRLSKNGCLLSMATVLSDGRYSG